jgi:hypothetical protein
MLEIRCNRTEWAWLEGDPKAPEITVFLEDKEQRYSHEFSLTLEKATELMKLLEHGITNSVDQMLVTLKAIQ